MVDYQSRDCDRCDDLAQAYFINGQLRKKIAKLKELVGGQMTDREKYIERLFSKSNDNESIKLDILADIAWSLSNIASMLMEYNGYSDCDRYLSGQWETEDD